MAHRYSNWTLQKCDQYFDKHFQSFETRKMNNKGMSAMKAETNGWVQFHYIYSDQCFHASPIASFIDSLNIKIWYRLNRNTLRGEICVRNIHDGIPISAPSATSMGRNYGSFTNIYPMDILLRALALHIEKLYYKFQNKGSNKSTTRPANNNRVESSVNKKLADEIPRRNGQSCYYTPRRFLDTSDYSSHTLLTYYGRPMYNPSHSCPNSHLYDPSKYVSYDTSYHRVAGRLSVSWVLLIEHGVDETSSIAKITPMGYLTAIKALINGPRTFLQAVRTHKPTWTRLHHSNKTQSPRTSNSPRTRRESSDKEKTTGSSEDSADDNNVMENSAASRPANLYYKTDTELKLSVVQPTDSSDEITYLIGTLSPVTSDISTSSVNERQRKLSETIVDWIFDESDSGPMSEVSEGASSVINDDPDETTECETEDEDLKNDKLHSKLKNNESTSKDPNKMKTRRIAANIFGGINTNSENKPIASSSNSKE